MQLPLREVNGPGLLPAREDGPAIASKLMIPLGLALSVITHLVFLGPALMLAGGSPFNTPPAEAITVDIVTPEELSQPANDQTQAETPPGENASALAQASPPPSASGSQPAIPAVTPPPQPAPTTPHSVLPPPPFMQPPPLPEPPPAAPNDPASMFGMPMTMPDGSVGGRTFDSQAVDRANVENDAVTAFRNQLKTCSKLPPGVAPEVRVLIRLYLMPDGSLATGLPANPELIEVDGASAGGGMLWNSAAAALRRCQPYKMLPPDRYQEWKMLDIAFTPQNF